MKYIKSKNEIKVFSKDEFNIEHILECGQVFCYKREGNVYEVFPLDKIAFVVEQDDCVIIQTEDVDFFENYFDLKSDYASIKQNLAKFSIMKDPLKFGYGLRILNQDLFETLISFIISANNNIKRIKLILNRLRENLGKKICDGVYSFPSYQELYNCSETFFKQMGLGYRSNYIYKVLRQIDPNELSSLKELPSSELKEKLLKLSGVGPKVADCIMLFGFHRGDVFPVDTWIHKMYNSYYSPLDNRQQIRKNLVSEFKDLSGYAQQYLFFYQRSGK